MARRALQLRPPYPPMEALLVERIPEGANWQYEPKWDGFRCLAFRDGNDVKLQSKSGQMLARYFPELVAELKGLKPKQFVLDGEIVVPVENRLSFDELLMRIHPAASRVERLSRERPATMVVFDILADSKGHSLVNEPLRVRRRFLEDFASRHFERLGRLRISPATTKLAIAKKWFESTGGNLDGIIAKRLDLPYMSGDRTGMQKIKKQHSVDCVVGGFRYASAGKVVGSLLLGLYENGLLHHVGFTSSLRANERATLTKKLESLVRPPGFTGRAPGGPSRWSTERSGEWQPVVPKLVVEVQYDHFTEGRFRHGTKLLRWRPDKSPRQCTMNQVKRRSDRQSHVWRLPTGSGKRSRGNTRRNSRD